VSIKLQIEAGIVRLSGGSADQHAARERFERTAEELNNVLGEVRRISHDLRPALLDDLGLAAALDHLAHEFSEHSGTPVRFAAQGVLEAVPAVVATVFFRIAQEALTNIERHAGARNVAMSLTRAGRQLELTVSDDGSGFDPEGVAVHPQHGIGLSNMAERMDAIGGTLDIASSSQGTTVRAGVELVGEGA
jgi:two-component system NarL family sensor kinase